MSQALQIISNSVVACLLVLLSAEALVAQRVVVVDRVYRYPARIRWAIYNPYDAVTSRIYAQADLIRAQGNAAVDYGFARNLHAQAYSKELDNWKKELRIYWERKALAEQKKLELDHIRQIKKIKYLNDQKWRNSRLWDRLKNHPELSGPNITNGSALNFLLARLAASSLPYRFEPATSRYSEQALHELDLETDLLSHLTLSQGAFKFSAGTRLDGSISSWPYFLRWDEFNSSRAAFEQARAIVVSRRGTKGKHRFPVFRTWNQRSCNCPKSTMRRTEIADWVRQHNRYTHFYSGDRFLQELHREIHQLQETGDIRPFGGHSAYDPKSDGEHVVSLLCFMNRNGVEFSKAKPGNEFAYHSMFVLMRALYLTVAEEDESLQPLNLGELAK